MPKALSKQVQVPVKSAAKPAAKKTSVKTAPKAKTSSKIKEDKISVVKEKDTSAKVLKADELLG